MATKKNVMTKEEIIEEKAVKTSKSSAKKPVEKAVKKSKSSAKKPVEKALKVTKKATKKAEEQVEEKKPAKKTVAKKTTAKKTVTKKATAKKEENPMDKLFPKELEVDGTKFARVQIIKSWDEFKEFVTACQSEGGFHVVLACNWPKKYRKEYNENNHGDKLFPKDGFEHDLDLQEVLMLQQTRETVITVSVITESVVLFREEYFELTDFGYFMINGMPFMVYTYSDAD